MRGFAIGVAVALTFGGAAWAGGSPITDEALASLKVGETTYQDVVSRFGHPTSTETSSDGSRAIAYAVVRTHVKASTFIPVVGLFSGGATARTQVDRFEFDRDGKLTKVVTNVTDVACGVVSGCKTPQ